MSSAIIGICLEFLCSQYIDCVNSTCLYNCLQLDYASSNYASLNTLQNCTDEYYYAFDTSLNTCGHSCQINCSCPPPTQLSDLNAFVAFNVVMLLAVVVPVIVANTAILVALVLESSIVKVVRLVLASILISCIISALGQAMYHIAGIVLSHYGSLQNLYNEPLNPTSCTISIFLILFGGAARLVFMATFSIVVYRIVKHGNANKKHLVVAVLVAVAVLWVMAFLGTSPMFSQEVVSTQYLGWVYCRPVITANGSSIIFWGLFLSSFGVVTPSVAVIFLLIVCCNKCNIASATAAEKAMVKFGFFLLLGNGLNMIGLVVPVLVAITASLIPYTANVHELGKRIETFHISTYTMLNAGLIPTPILILIFFKSVRKRLLCRLCCCMGKKRKSKRNRNNNNVEGRMVTTGV